MNGHVKMIGLIFLVGILAWFLLTKRSQPAPRDSWKLVVTPPQTASNAPASPPHSRPDGRGPVPGKARK